MSYDELGHDLDLTDEQRSRLETPAVERVNRFEQTHPRIDKELYGHFDDDERPLEEYRHTLMEALMSGVYWRIWRASDKMFMMVITVGFAAMLAGGLTFGHSWLAERETGNIPILSDVLSQIFGLPIFITAIYSSGIVGGAFFFRWKMDYDSIMTVCYIIEGHKRVIFVNYPSVMLLGRADQLTSGEFVMVLPDCCDDPNDCPHDTKKIFERDMEVALPAATSVGLNTAARKFELADRAQRTGEQFSPLPVKGNATLQKYMPYGIMHLVALGAAVVLFSLEDPTPVGSGALDLTPTPIAAQVEVTPTFAALVIPTPASSGGVVGPASPEAGQPQPSPGPDGLPPSPESSVPVAPTSTPAPVEVPDFMIQPTNPPEPTRAPPTATPVPLPPVSLPTATPIVATPDPRVGVEDATPEPEIELTATPEPEPEIEPTATPEATQ